MIMYINYKKYLKYIFIVIFVCGSFRVSASTGVIDSISHTAQICENSSCTISSTSPVNFGYFTTASSSNVTITDTELTGFIWGKSFGWVVLNCINTTSGCNSTNDYFKVSNTINGHLSGYAWGQDSGWINFGPFSNSATNSVTINSSGQFNGYAWAQNYGWIKFDCGDSNYCVKTNWRPQVQTGGGGSSGGTIIIPPSTEPPINPPTHQILPSVEPSIPPPSLNPENNNPGITVGDNNYSNNDNINIPVVGVISNQTNQYFLDNLLDFFKELNRIIRTPIGNIISKTTIAMGAIFGIGLSLATELFANSLIFSDIFLIPFRIWNLLLLIFGIKRNHPWGTIYDSVTKQPLDPAYVSLQDLQGNEITTSITDLDGRYGFLVPAGNYRIVVHKTNYEFPSKKLAGKTNDELYSDLYFNEIITIREGEVIIKNIPMDPVNFDWNEFAKSDQSLMRFYSKRDIWIANLSNILFYFGFALTTITVFDTPNLSNIIIFIIYILLFIFKNTILKPRPFGYLSYKKNGIPLSYAIIRVFSVGIDHEIVKKISNKTGKYYCLIPNGNYYIKVENKNIDESYSHIYTSDAIEVKSGYINKKFKI